MKNSKLPTMCVRQHAPKKGNWIALARLTVMQDFLRRNPGARSRERIEEMVALGKLAFPDRKPLAIRAAAKTLSLLPSDTPLATCKMKRLRFDAQHEPYLVPCGEPATDQRKNTPLCQRCAESVALLENWHIQAKECLPFDAQPVSDRIRRANSP